MSSLELETELLIFVCMNDGLSCMLRSDVIPRRPVEKAENRLTREDVGQGQNHSRKGAYFAPF